MKNNLIGNTYKMETEFLKVKLFFESDDSLEFTVLEGGGLTAPGHAEKVTTTIAEIRPNVYMIAWKEATGATVTHVEDHENGIVYSNATLPDGSFYTMKGTIQPFQE
ncbi:MoaF-related domain-containing protein [Flavobacterium subsaxonicum]|uniref:MoaF-like domain-containing protein n=1 Tax=Flavobacterium subsaxonicum WB 4.1-42 = DSM 21790 TaxID=1121898 RepID=A0A0A2MTV9_9FLAO|nr:hypothetical protein [Flavobacterium subsaxonicum]KGO95046.1 hypothetical protein Q766_02760 [Flavobacterium subsaxonicum WB 4.1-42 = DSM 21790]